MGKLCRKKLVQEALSFHRPTGPILVALSVQTAAVLCLEFLLLWVSFAALGLQVNPLLLVIAYCASDIIGRLAPTPGGVGFTELGMVTLISSFSLLGLEQAAAAVFLFRAALFLLPAFYGACCYTRLRFDESQTSDALKR